MKKIPNNKHNPVSFQWVENVLHVSGDLTHETVMAAFKKYLTVPLEKKAVTLNFNEINSCDSSSLAFLTNILRDAKKQNYQVEFNHLPSQMLKLAKVSGVNLLLPIIES